jgi:hypothetical protein
MPAVPALGSATSGVGPAPIVESALIASARNGDEAAWTQLVDLHLEAVWMAAQALSLPEAAAEDVCGLVWLRLAQRLGTAESPLRPWLLAEVAGEASRRHMADTPDHTVVVLEPKLRSALA